MMKALLALLLCNCLLVPIASGQSFAQKIGQQFEQLRKHGQGQNDRNQNDRGQNERSLTERSQNERTQNEKFQNGFAAPANESEQSSISRRDASDLARSAYQGRVLNIRRDGGNWRVRMDEGGTVFNVIVNADNGAVVRSSE